MPPHGHASWKPGQLRMICAELVDLVSYQPVVVISARRHKTAASTEALGRRRWPKSQLRQTARQRVRSLQEQSMRVAQTRQMTPSTQSPSGGSQSVHRPNFQQCPSRCPRPRSHHRSQLTSRLRYLSRNRSRDLLCPLRRCCMRHRLRQTTMTTSRQRSSMR